MSEIGEPVREFDVVPEPVTVPEPMEPSEPAPQEIPAKPQREQEKEKVPAIPGK